jgi:hypothetical protein
MIATTLLAPHPTSRAHVIEARYRARFIPDSAVGIDRDARHNPSAAKSGVSASELTSISGSIGISLWMLFAGPEQFRMAARRVFNRGTVTGLIVFGLNEAGSVCKSAARFG